MGSLSTGTLFRSLLCRLAVCLFHGSLGAGGCAAVSLGQPPCPGLGPREL